MNIHDLLPAVVVVVVIIIAGAFSASILSSVQQGQCATNVAAGGWNPTTASCYANSTTIASNVTGFGLTTLVNITNQMPNVGLIIVVAVIIGILIGSFIIYQKRK